MEKNIETTVLDYGTYAVIVGNTGIYHVGTI